MTYLRYVVAQTDQFSMGKPQKPTSSENPNSTDPSSTSGTMNPIGPTKEEQAFMDDHGRNLKDTRAILSREGLETLIE